jgi:hypothetical protein
LLLVLNVLVIATGTTMRRRSACCCWAISPLKMRVFRHKLITGTIIHKQQEVLKVVCCLIANLSHTKTKSHDCRHYTYDTSVVRRPRSSHTHASMLRISRCWSTSTVRHDPAARTCSARQASRNASTLRRHLRADSGTPADNIIKSSNTALASKPSKTS